MLVKDRLRQVERSRELDAWITEENYMTRVEEAAKAGNAEQTDKALGDTQAAFKTLASKRVTAASLLRRVFPPERYGEALKAATKAIAIPLPGQLFDNRRAEEATDLFQSAFKCLHAADFVELYQQTATITAVIPDATGEVQLRRLLREINTRFTKVVTPEVDVLRRALQRARREVRIAVAGPSGGQTPVEVARKEYERALAAKTLQLRNEERTEQYNALYTSFVRFLLHADYADLDRLRTVIKAQLVEIAPVGFTVPSQPKTLFQPGADEQRRRRRVDFLEWLNLEAAMALVALAQKHVTAEALQRLGYPTMTSYQPLVSVHRYYFQVPSPPRDAPQSRNKEPLKNLHFGADGEIWFEGTSFRAVTGLQRVPGKPGKKGGGGAKSFLDGETRDIARGDKIFEVADVLFDPALTPAEMKQQFNKKVDDLGRIEASLGRKKQQPSIFRMTVLRPIADVARPLAQRKIIVEKAVLLELLQTEAFVMQRDARNRSGLVFTGTSGLLYGMKKTVLGMEQDHQNPLQPGDRIQSIGGVVTAFDVYKGPESDAPVRLTADVRGQSEAYLTLVVERDGTPSTPLQDPLTEGVRALARRLQRDNTIASAGAVRDLLVQVGGLGEERATQIFGAPETGQKQSWWEWLRRGTPTADAAQVQGPTFLTSLRNAADGDTQYNGIISTIEKLLNSQTDSLSQGLPGMGLVRNRFQYVFFFTPVELADKASPAVIERMLKGPPLERNVYGYLATVEYRVNQQGCNRFSEDDASLCYDLKTVQVVGPPHGHQTGHTVSVYASKTQLESAYQRTDMHLRQLRSAWQGTAYKKPGRLITSKFVATMADDANKAPVAADSASTRAEALLVQSLLQAR